MITLRPSDQRGHADHGWLNTYHTFSFDTYRDPQWNGFRKLRVINDDIVQPGQGFGTHPHRDMEIVTYVLDGTLEHKDSMGNGSLIRPGDVQRMSAGSGVTHSEFNPSDTDPVHLLQIWFFPRQSGLEPSYEQKFFAREDKLNRLRLIASPDGSEGSVTIQQDASLIAAVMERDRTVQYELSRERHAWVHVATGRIKLGDYTLGAGDGAAISGESSIELAGIDEGEVLLFDLA